MAKPAGNALLSVYDKSGIVEFARGLSDLGWNIYASGGTAKIISDSGIKVIDVAKLVGGGAILGHRVVTLSREIFAGLLAERSNPDDVAELAALNIPFIDLVCVDMYPLEQEIAKPDATIHDVIEKTDIGGPSMLRAAAKGRRIVLSASDQREPVLAWLKDDKPNNDAFLQELAARTEYEVTRYTLALAKYLGGTNVSGSLARLNTVTKYGENPQQAEAGFYADNRVNIDPLGLDQFTLVKGVERSYINMTDIDRLLQTTTHIAAGFERNFGNVPAIAVGGKHGNTCGAAVSESHVEAVEMMLEGDTRAIFGGVVMINGEINDDVATALMKHAMDANHTRLLDCVIGASVTDAALDILSRKKLRVIVNPALADLCEHTLDTARRTRYVRGGNLEQPNYTHIQDLNSEGVKQHGTLTLQQKKDMILGWAIGCTTNSNTITLVKNGQLIGNGVGQQDRVGAGQLAISRTTTVIPEFEDDGDSIIMRVRLNKSKLSGAVAYSDSFFPFPDGPELLAKAGITAILTSSGSVSDDIVTKAILDAGVSVVMVPDAKSRGFYLH